MPNLILPPAIQAGYSHPEAFCHMRYNGVRKSDNIVVNIMIWNSRDGVTPMFLNFGGAELNHVNFHFDRFEPGYKPKYGDLIWASYDEQSAKSFAKKSLAFYQREYALIKDMTEEQLAAAKGAEFNRYGRREVLADMISDPEEYIKSTIYGLLQQHGEPEPRFLMVKEDWP